MDTRQITQVRPSGTKAPRRKPVVAIVVGLALVVLVAVVGALAVGSGLSDEGRQTTPAQVVHVAPGHTQPATKIYRIAMRPVAPTQVTNVAPGHTQPATKIHR